MEISKKLYLSLFCALDSADELELIGTSEGGSTYYAENSDVILWVSDDSYYIEDGDEFRGELPKMKTI